MQDDLGCEITDEKVVTNGSKSVIFENPDCLSNSDN
jgi:hypothetical protein